MIEVQSLTKKYGKTAAVDDISFAVRPGVITGFLGPNGAGKSTTMRAIMGLDRPTAGRVLINGHAYGDLRAPIGTIGALLDAKSVDKGRSARNHLRALGATVGIGTKRVDEVLATVGLTAVAHRAAGDFSLGMGQRLGIAAALLADPAIVMLDEPVNGLDPDGILWIRTLLRRLADEGRTVFLSSHLMSEMELTADHLVVIGKGRIIADMPMAQLLGGSGRAHVRVTTPDAARLQWILATPGVSLTRCGAHTLEVTGLEAAAIGDLALRNGVVLHELHSVSVSLEEAYMALTHSAVTHHGTTGPDSALLAEGARS
ncbi:ABC transporter ATP-binding protein [Cellulomonas sp. PhB150]|uniref:ABC transporter ATP-binding protein n=1 Tax=Cellulomonas sp. PhB150 TaxID=2485188 RepID=UPI000F463F04|nr:ABC transporter ATP-binding protein [Cellulomonas sp. PhB150]ROS31095.1 ABC-2 type transport system ATP-binding protein [Cellulomonas sp. PhB150]